MFSTVKQLLKLASQIKTGYIQSPLSGNLYLGPEASSEKNALNAAANQLDFIFIGINEKLSFPRDGILKVDSGYSKTWLKLLWIVLEQLGTEGAKRLLGALEKYKAKKVIDEVPGVKDITFSPIPAPKRKLIEGNVTLKRIQIGGKTFWKIDKGYAHEHYQIQASFPPELAQKLGAKEKVFFNINMGDMKLAILETELFRKILGERVFEE